MRTDLFDYSLPPERIAQEPVEPRDASRLMVLRRQNRSWEHRRFRDLPELLNRGDVLVRNDTRVVPARLLGTRDETGGRWEGLYLRSRDEGTWEILAQTRGRPIVGETFRVDGGLVLTLEGREPGGNWVVRPDRSDPALTLLEQFGTVPLPPYIRKGREGPGDRAHYQTIFARAPGSVAAPTAGLHFTNELLAELAARQIECLDVTLHVGLGTFRPIATERVEDHALHVEWARVTAEVAARLNEARAQGRRVVAVGTTTARTLESSARNGRFEPLAGDTGLYIKPGHDFRGVDALITNFHLPRSSLLVLVAALAGREFVLDAYREAIRENYRFYSYGDAMLVLP